MCVCALLDFFLCHQASQCNMRKAGKVLKLILVMLLLIAWGSKAVRTCEGRKEVCVVKPILKLAKYFMFSIDVCTQRAVLHCFAPVVCVFHVYTVVCVRTEWHKILQRFIIVYYELSTII